eukprot:g4063.t1
MSHNAYSKACSLIATASILPELVVFDLDYTLWPFWCETLTTAHQPRTYPDAIDIIDALKANQVKVAVASRTPTPQVADVFLDKLDLKRRLDNIQLIPASSGFDHHSAQKDKSHFPNIQQALGIDYSKMLFFDDEIQNIRKVSRLGVSSLLVDTARGVNLETLQLGLELFAKEKS